MREVTAVMLRPLCLGKGARQRERQTDVCDASAHRGAEKRQRMQQVAGNKGEKDEN